MDNQTRNRMTPKKAADLISRALDGQSTPEDAAELLIPPAAVDLHQVPRELWVEHIGRPVKIPETLISFIDGQTGFTQEERDGLEERIAAYYGVTAPYYITFEQGPPAEAWLGKDKPYVIPQEGLKMPEDCQQTETPSNYVGQ